jgi:ATP-dependent helicase HrpB
LSSPLNLIKLPVDDVVADIAVSIETGYDILLKASPGSGKTTRVPPALLSAVTGAIWVLEPRRLAARMSATRVAEEYGERPGDTIGWQMRFDTNYGPQTRILFLTEGMFTARLAQDPELTGVSCIILDEFHERHQQTDVAFALCRKLQATARPDLRLIIMSATLDLDAMRQALPKAQLIEVTAPVFPVQTRYWRGDYQLPVIDKTVKGIIETTADQNHNGHLLVFLPGTAEIVRVKSQVQRLLNVDHWMILELRGSLDRETQDLAFAQTTKRKIILATNIAESSLTIPGVTAVVDSGLARVPTFNLFTGLSTLETRPVSKASLIQRQGRAGRTAPGLCLRLFSEADYAARPESDTPEIGRLDLSQVYLTMEWLAEKTTASWKPDELPWLSPPEQRQWDDAKKLLIMLNLINTAGQITRTRVATLPLHPRLARFADACYNQDLGDVAPWLTAILANSGDVKPPEGDNSHLGCDLTALYESVRKAPQRYGNIIRAAQQIARLVGESRCKDIAECPPSHELHLAPALLQAFPDRVMIRRDAASAKTKWISTTICTGGDLALSPDSAASHAIWMIALDASSTRITGSAASGSSSFNAGQRDIVTMASMLSPDDLKSAPEGFLTTEELDQWDDRLGKSRRLRLIKFGVLTVSSALLQEPSAETSTHQRSSGASLLAEHMNKHWPKPFAAGEFFDQYLVRQQLLLRHKLASHAWDADELKQLLIAHICDEADSFAAVTARPLDEWLRHCVGEDEFTSLNKYAPVSIKVGAGHRVDIHYPTDAPPWIEARLQNFFGQAETPKILEGRLPLTLHLLAPNMRALQVTTDLASFWRGVYPSLRNEYMRKYPRHYWPENPMEAEPPPMRPRKR